MIQGWKTQLGARIVAAVMVIGSAAVLASCEQKGHVVGSVNTEFNLIGPDHKIVIESYDDPKIDGITVFISKSQTGGIKALWGWRKIPPTPPSRCARLVQSRSKKRSRMARTPSPKNARYCSSGCMSRDSGTRRIKVLSMWCGPTGLSMGRRRIQFRRWWQSRGGHKRPICR